jgi:hypothetical protein
MDKLHYPAFYDTFSGLIPCLVVGKDLETRHLTVKITANRGPYKRGQIISDLSFTFVVPRKAVFRSRQAGGKFRIRPYSWSELLPR